MNDYEAMELIGGILKEFFEGEHNASEAMCRIAYVSGQNVFEHDEAAK